MLLRSLASHLRGDQQPAAAGAAAQQQQGGDEILECRDCTGNLWRLAVASTGAGALTVVPSPAGLSAAPPAVAFPLPDDAATESQLYGLCDDVTGAVWLTDGAGLWRLDPRRTQGRALSDVGWQRFDVPAAVPMRELELQLLEEGVLITNLHQWDSGHAVCGIQPSTRIPAGKTEAEAYAHHVLSVTREGESIAQSIDGVEFPDAWRQGPRLPFGNHDIHSTVCGDTLYVSGGLAHAGFPCEYRVFHEVFALKAGARAWEVVARMPERRTYNGLTALDGELWFCGGADGPEGHTGSPQEGGPANRIPSASVFVLNPATGQWRTAPPLNTARIECTSLAVGGRIYTFGGASHSAGGTTHNTVESIAPGEASWRMEPPMPVGLKQFGGCVIDGIVYLVGGVLEHDTGFISDHSPRPSNQAFLRFDPASGSWDHGHATGLEQGSLAAHPAPTQAPCVAAHDGKVWHIAGNPPSGFNTTNGPGSPSPVWSYDPAENEWALESNLPTQRAWGAAHSFQGHLFCISGSNGFGFDPRVFVLGGPPAAVRSAGGSQGPAGGSSGGDAAAFATVQADRVATWDTFAVRAWLASELALEEVAAGADAAEIDGATALEMEKEDWKELGATGIQSAKIVGALKKLAG